ncbi:MAG: FAD:protein FMN transferase [Gemmatimonadota bacterium]|nr:FAD:protein FMN transferase [Gemmatimonadota bacterium]
MNGARREFSRRDFIALGTGTLVVLSLPRAAAGRRRMLTRRTVPSMGSFAELVVVSDDRRLAEAAIDAAIGELRAVEDRLTRFRPDSDVGRANRARAGAAVSVSPETATALEASLAWARRTDGRFDPCLERAIDLWDVASRREPPGAKAVRRFAGRRLYRSLEIERRGVMDAIRLHDVAARIDLGGIGKGLGVDRAVAALREHGVRDALVNLGGDLYAMGASDDGNPWEIGIRSPTDPARVEASIRLTDSAVATSGDYVQYFDHAGRRYHHLIDPMTGEPGRPAWHSLTVTAPSCLAADAAATALFASEPVDASRLLNGWEPAAAIVAG